MKRFVQFIAGAICPSCKEKDTIALNTNNDEIYCVKCDFKDKRPSEEGLKNTIDWLFLLMGQEIPLENFT